VIKPTRKNLFSELAAIRGTRAKPRVTHWKNYDRRISRIIRATYVTTRRVPFVSTNILQFGVVFFFREVSLQAPGITAGAVFWIQGGFSNKPKKAEVI
jgi:hypothetical protein